LVIAISAMY